MFLGKYNLCSAFVQERVVGGSWMGGVVNGGDKEGGGAGL